MMSETVEGKQIVAWLDQPSPKARVSVRNDLSILELAAGEVLVKLECTGVWYADGNFYQQIEGGVNRFTSGYGAHAVMCTAGVAGAYKHARLLLRKGGTIICVGLAEDNLSVSPFETVVRGLRVIGPSVVTAEEMQELLEMALAGDVIPNVEVFHFESIDTVLQALAKSQIARRVVVKPPRLALLFNE